MELYLMITQINDFIFCPRSLLFHDFLRANFSSDRYRETPQVQGLASHAAIDKGTYSTRKNILQGTMVYSEKYKLLGRIDTFDIDSGTLTERKYSVTAIYDGFKYQLYAQYFALLEMGFKVTSLKIYSSKDNKKYNIPLPDAAAICAFENVLDNIRNYTPENDKSLPNLNKCHKCNYREICCFFPEEERI